jgi:hypothetical protein
MIRSTTSFILTYLCVSFNPLPIYDHYTVYIAPGFSDEQKQLIINALSEWQQLTSVSFDVFDNDVPFYPIGSDVVISPIASTKNCPELMSSSEGCIALTKLYPITGGAKVFLPLDLPDHMFKQVSLHETGHSIMNDHIDHIGSIMYPYYGFDSHLTCWDVQEFYRARSQNKECEGDITQ